ncbi:hypothetical protein MY3296_005014 [Beauveria thailandica]
MSATLPGHVLRDFQAGTPPSLLFSIKAKLPRAQSTERPRPSRDSLEPLANPHTDTRSRTLQPHILK